MVLDALDDVALLETLRPRSSLCDVRFCFTSVVTARTFRTAFSGQCLLQQTRGLTGDTPGERESLAQLLDSLYSAVLRTDANAEKLGEVVRRLEEIPPRGVTYIAVRDTINSTGIAIGLNAKATVAGSEPAG